MEATGLGSMTLADLFELAHTSGLAFVYFLIIYGGYKQWWVWGWLYKQAIQERDQWKDAALKSTSLAETFVKKVNAEG